MGREDVVGHTGDFNYSGYIDWPQVYQSMTAWCNKELFKIYETLYKDKSNRAGFAEREVTWYVERKVDRMNRYALRISIKMWDVQSVQITKDGKTSTVDRGRMRVRITAIVDQDWQNIFDEKNKFYNTLWKIYNKLIDWDYNLGHWDIMYAKMFELLNEIKKQLGVDVSD